MSTKTGIIFIGATKTPELKRKIIHLYLKSSDEHKYYTSLQALYNLNTVDAIGISKFTLDRYDFSSPYENEKVIIRKGWAAGTGEGKPKKKNAEVKNAKTKKK